MDIRAGKMPGLHPYRAKIGAASGSSLKYHNSVSDYSFTPPSATPAMMYFERKKYITRIGITVVRSPQ